MKKITPQNQTNKFPRLAAPAQRALAGAGITSLQALSRFSEAEIQGLHGIGPNALRKLHQALAENGLSFAEKTRNPTRQRKVS